MVAYDSRWMPDPAHLLRPETEALLREALAAQRTSGDEPISALTDAIRTAAREARERQLPPEALLVQLKSLADEAGISTRGGAEWRGVREWMVIMLLRAYWE
jgi:hypothetical protein